MFFQNVLTGADIGIVTESFVHFEVVAPAGDLYAIVAEGFGLRTNGIKRQVGPLASEESNRTGHGRLLGMNCELVCTYEINFFKNLSPSSASASCVGARLRQM